MVFINAFLLRQSSDHEPTGHVPAELTPNVRRMPLSEAPNDAGFGAQLGTMVSATTAPPAWWLLLITGALAVFIRFAGRWFWQANVVSTIVHEGGHALVSLLCGGGVRQIEITSPDSGRTLSQWLVTRGEEIAKCFAGYAMPPLAGWGCAALLAHGSAAWVLFAGALAMLAILLVVRDAVSFAVVLLVGSVFAGVLWWGPVWLHLGVAATVMWLLLLGEIPGVWHLVRGRLSGEVLFKSDDAWSLYCDTSLPAPVWFAAWYAVIAWCCWSAFWLLWPVS